MAEGQDGLKRRGEEALVDVQSSNNWKERDVLTIGKSLDGNGRWRAAGNGGLTDWPKGEGGGVGFTLKTS